MILHEGRWEYQYSPGGQVITVYVGMQEAKFDFEPQVHPHDNERHQVVCVNHKWASVSSTGTGWVGLEWRVTLIALRTESQFCLPCRTGDKMHQVLVLPVVQTPYYVLGSDLQSVERNCMSCANASAQIHPALYLKLFMQFLLWDLLECCEG